MPTFQYEAMDNTGLEVKDTIDAASEQEAQSRIREKGFFVTKITEKGRGKKTTRNPEKLLSQMLQEPLVFSNWGFTAGS